MPLTAPQEDPNPENTHTTPTTHQRKRPVRRRHTYDYDDDAPITPPIRRASLYTDSRQISPTRRSRQGIQEETHEHYHEYYREPQEQQAEKIIVTRRPRSDIYEPPPNTRGSRGARKRSKPSNPPGRLMRQTQPSRSAPARSLHSYMQRFELIGQNRILLLIGGVLLALLIILPIATNIGHGQSVSLVSIGTTTGATNSKSSAPTDASHQLVITPPNNGHPAPPVFATSAYLLDADSGATLYAHNPFMHLPMLSTTKLMTALLAAEEGNLDQKVIINDQIANDMNQLSADSALMGLKKGEAYTMRDLLYGLLLPSGNDAAIAIADTIGGNLQNFVAKMNQRASQMGLHDTHFENPHGLLMDNHYSSAHDLAILGKVSLGMPAIHEISNTKEYQIPKTAEHAAHDLINGNQFMWWYPGVDGGKTGWDAGTDFIQVVSCVRSGHHLIGVVMHTNDWWTDMRDLMNWGFSNFTWLSPHDLDTASSPIPFDADWNYFVKDKKENTIPMGSQGRYYIYTGYSVSGAIMAYFDKNGGLKKFGFPISQPQTTNNTTLSQRFEHATIQCDVNTKQCKAV